MKITDLKLNPNNPRIIKDDKFKKLVTSLSEFPEMMEKRPMVCVTDTDGKLYPLGGNMRLRVLKELKYKEIPDSWVMLADEWSEEKRKEFTIKDNVGFGEWDFDTLANAWAVEELAEWGLDIPNFEIEAVDISDLGLKDNAFSEAANSLSFSITFNFPISEKEAFDRFEKSELETVLKDFVYA
jgi:hypothetical protein